MLGGSYAYTPYSLLSGASAIDVGLASTGGLLPGWQAAQRLVPGGFDPNYYRSWSSSSSSLATTSSGFNTNGSNLVLGTWGNDYISGYSWTTQEVDVLAGSYGADQFSLGTSWGGVYYQGSAFSIIADYNPWEGDVIEISPSGYGLYQVGFANALGNPDLDTLIFYGNDLVSVIVDNTNLAFTWG